MRTKTNLILIPGLLISCLLGTSQEKHRSLDADVDVRSVQGVVTYAADEPVKGAVVKCEDTNTLEIRSFITGPDGKYHFMNLSTNVDYELKADSNGKSSAARTLSAFDTKAEARINLQIK